MVEETPVTGSNPIRERVGDRLRAAREAAGLTLTDIGQRTRIPLRHLEAVETSNYGSLPSITYAMGFSRAFARAVGEDEVRIASDLRGELANTWQPVQRHEPYDFHEPARLPPRGIALAGVAVAVLILIGLSLWFGTSIFRGEDAPAVASAGSTAAPAVSEGVPVPAPTPAATPGQVTLTATDEVWVRVYDGQNNTLLTRTMKPGERFDIPPGTERPMVNVGRPDKLAVSIDGQPVAPLGPPERAIKDVVVTAEALRARGA
jgi:cytoskeleton protein RodZ